MIVAFIVSLVVFVVTFIQMLEYRVAPNHFAINQGVPKDWVEIEPAEIDGPTTWKRIVQTNKTSLLPKRMVVEAHKWTRINPSWHYAFFDDETAERVIRRDNKAKLALENLRRIGAAGAAVADLFRAVEISERGGWYVDMDCGAIDPLELRCGDDAVFYIEHRGWLCHWFFFAKPKHPILTSLREEVLARTLATHTWTPGSQIFHVTGPGVLDEVAQRLLPQARKKNQWVAGTYALGSGRTVRLRYTSLLPHLDFRWVTHGIKFSRLPCSQKYYGSSSDQESVSPHYTSA